MDPEKKRLCLIINFDDDNDDFKLLKIDTLKTICKLFCNNHASLILSDDFLIDVIDIVEKNLFRNLPPLQQNVELIHIGPNFNFDEVDSVEDPQMNHLIFVYKLFYRFFNYFKHKTDFLEVFIDEVFIENFISLIKSEDMIERESVTNIIIAIFRNMPCHRNKIYKIVIQYLSEIITEASIIHIHLENLLDVLLVTLDTIQLDSIEVQRLLRILISFHRIPYLYRFYSSLFSCCIHLLRQYPEKILPFAKRIIPMSNNYYASLNLKIFNNSNRLLRLLEIYHIYNLIFELNENEIDETKKKIYTDMAIYLCPTIINLLEENIKSQNILLINASIKFIFLDDNWPVFEKCSTLLKKRLTPIIQDNSYLVTWDEKTFVNQTLFGIFLQRYLPVK